MDKISPRERVALTLAHQEPDLVPIDIGEGRQTSIYKEPYLKLAEKLGLGKVDVATSSRAVVDRFDESLFEALDIDFRRVSLRDVPEDQISEPTGIRRDVWGIGWKKSGHFWSPVEHPLKDATIDDLGRYPWPDPNDERRFKGLKEEAEFKWKNTEYAIVAKQPNHVFGILAQSIYLRSMENFFVDLLINKEFAQELMERVLEYHLKIYERFIEEVGEFVSIVHTGSDLGTQDAPYFSLELYREMIKPKQKQLMRLIKNKTKAKIFYHSDGAVFDFIEDLVDIGIEILNPIQVSAKGMDPSTLKKTFGDRLSFHGGIDQQQFLTWGTPEEVEEDVKQRIRQLGPNGGYILASVQTILPGVPPENVIKMFHAARQYGRYPV